MDDHGDAGSQEDNAQMEAIQAEKRRLAWQMYGLIFLGFLVSLAFYGVTILENPQIKPTAE